MSDHNTHKTATVTIGKLAKACGVNIDTVRYYEKIGLLSPWCRTISGYRLYNSHSQNVLQFIRHAQHIGFTLEEIKDLLALNEMPLDKCEEVQKKIKEKIHLVEAKEHELGEIKKALQGVYKTCNSDQFFQETCSFLDVYKQEN